MNFHFFIFREKEDIFTAVILTLLMTTTFILRNLWRIVPTTENMRLVCSMTRSFIYIGLFICWGMSVARRIIQKQVRFYMMAIAMLAVFLMIVRTIKYHAPIPPGVQRQLWYMYYFPMLFIPFFGMLAAFSLGKPERFRLRTWTYWLYVPTGLLLLLVLTNDLHQLAFSFPLGLEHFENGEYCHEVVYWLTFLWMGICLSMMVIMLFVRSRLPNRSGYILLPVVLFICMLFYVGISFVNLELTDLLMGDMTVVLCLFIIALFECCFAAHLIQTNTNYVELFRIAALGVQIADENYNIMLSTDMAETQPANVLRAAEAAPVMLNEHLRLSSAPIHGGHVLWTDDVSELQNVLNELQELQENMEDENAILSEEYELKVHEAHIAEQDRLYNEIQQHTARQIELLVHLTQQFERAETEDERVRLLGKIIVIGAYLKRRNNLIFISDKTPVLNVRELELAFRESLSNLELNGIDCGFKSELTGELPAAAIMKIYDFFEKIVEYMLDSMSAIHIVIRKAGSDLCITVTTDGEADVNCLAAENISVIRDDDGEWQLTMVLGGDGT